MFERLDRTVANPQWLNARVENLPITGSDYGSILLSMDCWNQKGKYLPFRFEAKWLLQENFPQLVQQTWRKFIKGSYAKGHMKIS